MICPYCHKKVNRIRSCRIITLRGTAKSKNERVCQNCAQKLLLLTFAELPEISTETELDMIKQLLQDTIQQILQFSSQNPF